MGQNEELLVAKRQIKDTPGDYLSHTLELTFLEDQNIYQAVYEEATKFANSLDLDIVQISPYEGTFPNYSITMITKKGSWYKR